MDQSHEMTSELGRKAGRGLRWSVFGTVLTKLGSFAMGLVLARLLTPDDFGLFAVAMAAAAFVMHVNDVGLIAATQQWRGRIEEMAPTASGLAFVFSLAAYGAIYFVAPYFAALAGSPDATGVIRLLTLIIVVDGITAVRAGNLMRTFQQDKLTKANMIGMGVNAALAIGLAVVGAGPFSFAAGQVAGAVATGVLVFAWGDVPVKIGFDRAVARKLMRFGVPLAASLGVEAILMNADYVIVGRFMGATALGFYLLAFNVSSWVPSVVGTAVRYVSVASFSRLAEREDDTLSAGVQRSVPLLVAGVVPVAVLMAALAPALVVALYGGEWAPAAPVLRFLAILTVVRMLTAFAMDILMGAGATRATVWINLGWSVALVPALLLGVRLGGIQGVAVAHAVIGLLVAVPLVVLALHRTGVRLAPLAPALVRPLLGGALAGTVAVLLAPLSGSHLFLQLGTAGTAGLLGYVLAVVPREQLRRWSGRVGPALARSR